MERKIKFRGKTVSGRWVYGDLLHITNTDGISGTIIVKENQATAQTTDYDNALCYARNEIDVVIPDTVGQFTGLLDKNGKEIYEGDILCEIDNDRKVVVVYDAPQFCYADNKFGYRFLNLPDNYIVVGNIHDNPELLKRL